MPVTVRMSLAAIFAAVVVLSAPFSQQFFEWLAGSGASTRTFALATQIPVGLALLVALIRIRERRFLRLGLLAASLALALAYVQISALTVGEQFHFVEYGLVALAFYWACRPLGDASLVALPVVATIIAGTCDEWFQWFIPIRTGEARDVALNAVAGVCGVLVGVAAAPPAQARWDARTTSRVARWIGAGVVVFLLFVSTVHVGYEIALGPATFRSRYTEAELGELSRDRAGRWRAAPPLERRRVGREDQYLSEGLRHVQRRNMEWESGNIRAAWLENAIAERFYAPILDTASYASTTPPRWGIEQRADAQARTGDGVDPYASPDPLLHYTWPRGLSVLFLLKLLLVPSLVAGVTLAVRRWGPAVGGWLAGLPIVAGPVLVFYGIEQGPAFAARAAQATMAAMAVNAVFSVIYSWLSRRLPWFVCVPLGWTAFAFGTIALNATQPGLVISLLLPVAGALGGLMLMPPAEPVSRRSNPPRGDLIVRLIASTTLVLVLTSLAARLGPSWSGLLAAFPVVISTVAAFTHAQRGPAAVAAFFHGFVPATLGFVVFCFVMATTVTRLGVALATIAALAIQLIVHGTVVRWLTRPTTLRE